MEASAHSEGKPRRRPKKKVLKLVLLLVFVLVLLAVFAVPWFVSSEAGREIILTEINSAVDGEADFADLSMSWSRGVEITDFSFSGKAGGVFVQARRIAAKPHYVSILMGSLSFGKAEILEPRVEISLIQPEVPQNAQGEETGVEKSRSVGLPIKRIDLVVKDGSLKVSDAKAGTVELSEINANVNLRRSGEQADFDVNLAVAEGGRRSRVHAAGKFNLKRSSGEITIEVDNLGIGAMEPIFALAGVDVRAEGNITADVAGEIKKGQIEKLSAEADGRGLDIDAVELTGGRIKTTRLDVNVKLARSGDMINIESFDIDADWFNAAGSGTVPTSFGSLAEFLKTDASLSGHFELDAAQVFAQMPGVFGLKEGTKVTSGILRGDIETLTEAGKRKIRGQANLERLEGMVDGRIIALSGPVRADMGITSDKAGVRFDKLDLSSAFAEIDCSGTVERFSYRGDIDLAKLQAELGQFVDMKGYEIGGGVSGNGEVSIKEDKYAVGGSSVIKNLKVGRRGENPFEQDEVSVGFDVEVSPAEEIINVSRLEVESDQIKIHNGEFSRTKKGDKTKLQGRAELEYDWAAVSNIARMFLPAGLALEGQRKDTISFVSEYPKGQEDEILGNLSAGGKLGFAGGSYFGLNFGPTEADIQIEDGLMKIAPFSTTVNKGRFNFAGRADFKQKPTLLGTPGPIEILKDIQINEETTRKLLMYLNPIFADAVNVSGVANFNCERLAIPLAGGGKNNLEVIGTVSITQMRLQASELLGRILAVGGGGVRGQNIAISPTKFVLRDGFLRYDDMEMIVGDNPVNFSGVIGLDRSLNMRVTLPYTTRGETVKVGKEVKGERISLPLRGSLNKPELDLGRLLEEQLIPQLNELLEGELEGLFEKRGNRGGSD